MTLPTCLIYNPAAGRGRAERLLAELRSRVPPGAEFRPTREPGHAAELATAAAKAGFGRVVAAGGDGTVHEVANGLLRADAPGVRFAVLPVGSMNDYAFTLGVDAWWHARRPWDELTPMAADVGLLRAGGRERYFVNGCGLGFNGMVTIEARKIRWLRGVPLYALAVLKSLVRHFDAPPLRVRFDNDELTIPTLALSLGIGQREGGFPLTALAELDDGAFDLLHVGGIRRWELIRHFPAMISGDLPTDHPKIRFGRGRSVSVSGRGALCVHADGELVCTPGDAVYEFAAEVLPQRLTVEVYPPALYGGGQFDPVRKHRGVEKKAGPRTGRVEDDGTRHAG